jgi:hypothetical protein
MTNISAEFDLSVIKWQLTPYWNSFKQISSLIIVMGDRAFESLRGLQWTYPFFHIPPFANTSESTSPAIAYTCSGNFPYVFDVKCLNQTLATQRSYTETAPVIPIVPTLARHHKQQKRRPLRTSHLHHAYRYISARACRRYPSQLRGSVGSTI